MPAGRPSLISPEIVEEAGRLAAIGFPLSKIAQALNIHRSTLHRWIDEGATAPEDSLERRFRDNINAGYLKTGAEHLQNLRRQSADGSTAAATWFLTHHPFFRDDFSDAAADRRVEKRTMATVMEAIIAAGLPPEQERILQLSLKARGLGTDAPQEPSDADL